MQQQGTISQVIVTGDKKWILFDNWQRPAQWLDQEEAPKALPKTRLAQKKVMVTVWWSAAHIQLSEYWQSPYI